MKRNNMTTLIVGLIIFLSLQVVFGYRAGKALASLEGKCTSSIEAGAGKNSE